MVVNTTLTTSMLQRLAKIESKYKEKGKEDDPTRLCNSWKGALDDDKLELEKLVTDMDLAGKLSAGKIKEECPKCNIYTTACVQNALGNYKQKAKKAIDDRSESKCSCASNMMHSKRHLTHMSFNICYAVQKKGGGGEGLKAHNSEKKPDAKSVSGKTLKTEKSKAASTKKPSVFPSTSTMCKCDATARSAATMRTNTGLSFAGRTHGADGAVRMGARPLMSVPVFCTLVDRAIGGALAFSQLDPWTDDGLNKRASCDLMVCNGAVIDGDTVQCRPSAMNPSVVIISFYLSDFFTNPDRKLSFLLERIATVYPETQGDEQACLKILKNHPRHVSALMNLKSLLGSHNNRHLVEFRITAPFKVSENLVTREEDPVFYGFVVTQDEETAETHIHFELKEKDRDFKPVTVDGLTMPSWEGSHSRAPKGMFSQFTMGAIPENITFQLPSGKHRRGEEHEDDSTIKTKEQEERFKTTGLDDDDDEDDESWDSKLGDDEMDVDDSNSEVEKLRKEIDELRNIASGVYQTNSKDSASGNTATTSNCSTPKKKKNNEGAASVAGSRTSRHSTATRGTQAREDKRKASGSGEDASKKHK